MKYIFFTNIPTPYRTDFYNTLQDFGLEFEVYYMRETEADRNWKIHPTDLKHNFYIDKGWYKMISRFHVHFNPRLIYKILKAKQSEVIIGGAWNDIDVLILVLLKRLGLLKKRFHFWSEANHLTVGASNDNFFKKFLRKFVYHSSNGAQLSSGKMTEITLEKWGIKSAGFVQLPNTIEEDKFQISAEEIALRDKNDMPKILMPVRLLERDKGILNFFKCIGIENIQKAEFLLAGDGPDRNIIESYIVSNNLRDHIKILGHCDTKTIIALYKQANLFLLPSFSDPSPLSLIEALSMKLPVLVSERCGNHFEAVTNKLNGYIFDPLDCHSVQSAFETLMNRSEEWQQLGEKSKEIYNEKFYRSTVINRFIKELKEFSKN